MHVRLLPKHLVNVETGILIEHLLLYIRVQRSFFEWESWDMSEIFQVIAELSLKLHPDRLEAIAVKIGSLDSYKDFQKLDLALDQVLIQY